MNEFLSFEKNINDLVDYRNHNEIIPDDESKRLVQLYISLRDNGFFDRYLSLSERSNKYYIVSFTFCGDLSKDIDGMEIEETKKRLKEYKRKIYMVKYFRHYVVSSPYFVKLRVEEGDIEMYGEIERLFFSLIGQVEYRLKNVGFKKVLGDWSEMSQPFPYDQW